jgi:carboxyl-terminal processing protease
MTYKGRTVIVFMLIGMLLGGVFTFTLTGMWDGGNAADAGTLPSRSGADAGGTEDSLAQLTETSGLSRDQLLKLARTYQLIDTRFYKEVDSEKVIDGAIEGMLRALDDPYSVYMDAVESEQFTDAVLESTFSGIGAEVSMEDGKVVVVSPIKGSPAERAGVRSRDVILSVNDETLEGLTLNEAVMKIRGPKGTKANLLIQREGAQQPIEIVVVRDDIDVETVYARMLEDNIGYIEVRQFAQNTAVRFLEELASLEKQGIRGLIIDVRNNPGGVLETVIAMAEPFVPQGKTIVQVENRAGERTGTVSMQEGGGKNYPVAVLINGGSASASEILAAAVRESGGGTLIGEKTFGKGLVQSTFDSGVADGSSIKLTIAKWLTPEGNYIQGTGIEPDLQVSLPEYYQVAPMSKQEELGPGDLNDNIRFMQIMLDGLGFAVDRKDGYYSKATEQAVRQFQSKHELPVTGRADVATQTAIEQALIQKMIDPKNDLQLNRAIEHVKSRMKD